MEIYGMLDLRMAGFLKWNKALFIHNRIGAAMGPDKSFRKMAAKVDGGEVELKLKVKGNDLVERHENYDDDVSDGNVAQESSYLLAWKRTADMDCVRPWLRTLKTKPLARAFLAEFMGTFILMVFGIGSVAQAVLGRGAFGTFLSINISWGLGVTFGVFWSAGISGGHINPAVSLAMACFGRLSWKRLPVYWLAQTLGSFIASACMYGVYADALDIFDGGKRVTRGTSATAGIWSTYLYSYNGKTVSNWAGFGDQVFGTMILVGTIFALTDKRNSGPGPKHLPYMVGCLVWAIGMTMGLNCGYGINPARDLIPRIFTAMAGWGSNPFTVDNNWFWYPILGQLVGGILGGLLYMITIELHHPDEEKYECAQGSQKQSPNVKYTTSEGASNINCEINPV